MIPDHYENSRWRNDRNIARLRYGRTCQGLFYTERNLSNPDVGNLGNFWKIALSMELDERIYEYE